ncbi:hypothetical protein [Dapis sp. BLCC M172]|uniref:hypothetical protein n=1 Tax=Dapis sp. BLCC M172 TaxID=2975281 RepID=UPI003CEDF11A
MLKKIKNGTDENYDTDEEDSNTNNEQPENDELLVVPYLVPIAFSDNYPIP